MSKSLPINKADATSCICAALLFIISFPKWVWGRGSNIIFVASLLLFLLAVKDINKKRLSVLGLVVLLMQTVLLWEYNVRSDTNLNGMLMVFVRGLGFSTIFLCSADYWKKTTDCFIKLLAVFLIPALIEHVLIVFVGITTTTPTHYECPINPDRMYEAYWFNVYIENSFGFFDRFYAFYDEPGVLGNILMVLLYIQRFDLRKWYNVIFLISGLLSFSLAFYIAVAAYYILFGKTRSRILFIIITVLAVLYFYNNEYVYDLLFRRFTIEDGEMVGYNRENGNFLFWFESIQWTKYFFWGYQPREQVVYAASWKWAFACYGIVPVILFFLSIVLSKAKLVRGFSDLLKCFVLMAIIWIQRPFVHLYLYSWLIVIPFIYLSVNVIKPENGEV